MGCTFKTLSLLMACAIVNVAAQPYQVNEQPLPGCDTKMGIRPYDVPVYRGVKDAPCTGLLTYNLDGNIRDICADHHYFNKASAQRLCFTLGLNMYREPGADIGARLYSCDRYVEDNAPIPDDAENLVNEVDIYSVLEKDCNIGTDVTTHSCFDTCYFGQSGSSIPYSTYEENCDESKEPFWGIVCSDINECLNGALVKCKTPFDGSCQQRKACGPNTTCTNIIGSYKCDCMNGYTPARGDENAPYSLDDGCVDVDECSNNKMLCGETGQCQNTAGSYICMCPLGTSWNDNTKTCLGSMCDISINDPNAGRPIIQLFPVEQATFICNVGFKAPRGTNSYTIQCINGNWEDHDLCEEVDPCDDYLCFNGDCIVADDEPTCECHRGYQGFACDEPKVSTAMIVAICAMVLGGLLLVTTVFLCIIVLNRANDSRLKTNTEELYGSGPPPMPKGRPFFRMPPFGARSSRHPIF